MLPFVFEWHWDWGHVIFFGLFYGAVSTIGLGLLIVAGKTAWDLFRGLDHHH